ncbi:hypothetical protein C2S51_014767 [Perilla frutescens var. frutescens]|nr:hypothetical protein C2S51_014767 [Perilla frutescens var. frutescens]
MANKIGKRKQSDFTFDDDSVLQPHGIRTHDDLSQIANAQPDMPNRGDNGPRMTLRTQGGKRIYNGLRDRQCAPVVDANYLHGHECVNIPPTRRTDSTQKDADALSNHPDNRCINDLIFENEHMNDIGYDSDNIVKETRGPTYMQNIWGRPPHLPRIQVEYNKSGQPVGGESSTLSHFLGSISRNGKYCPIDVINWHKMPSTKKSEILDTVKLRFNVSPIAEKWILSSVGHKWRNLKHFLKTKYWADVPIENLIDDRDERVLLDQWIKLLTYWNTDEVKKVSKRNKDARDKKLMNQRTEKTSFAQIKAKLAKEKGRSPTRVELFSSCFFNSNGSSDDVASSKYVAMQEHTNQLPEGCKDPIGPSDVFAQVMGQDKSGHVRMLGQGICPSDVWGETPRYSSNRLLMQKESRIIELEAMLSAQQGYVSQSRSMQQTSAFSSLSTHVTTNSPIQVGAYVLLQSLNTKKNVAKGRIHSINPTTKVGGQILGSDWCEVYVMSVLELEETLIRPYDKFQKLKDTFGEMIAWPCSLDLECEHIQLNDDLQFILENDSPMVKELMESHTNEIFAKVIGHICVLLQLSLLPCMCWPPSSPSP